MSKKNNVTWMAVTDFSIHIDDGQLVVTCTPLEYGAKRFGFFCPPELLRLFGEACIEAANKVGPSHRHAEGES